MTSQSSKVDFSGVRWGSVEWTNLGTLYLRACESRWEHPILGDHAAAEAVTRINYDFKRLHRAMRPWPNQFLVALRAKKFDVWSTAFLHRHPDAVVLHLGCGLDSRALRLEPPATVRWFDVDQPAVIELRRRLYEDRDGYRMIGSSVTDREWLEQIPADHQALVVAEGLLMYLTESQVRDLLARLTHRFSSGELLFDTLSPIGPRISRLLQGGIVKWGIADAREIERWQPRLRCLEQTSAVSGYESIPLKPQRVLFRLVYATPMRKYDMLNRFAF
jgi:O-methyltransferase involved in polyketide biosynthesis